ncbi:MAG: DUF4421 family protein [Prevotella sp.]|nr:DUF4421 family protein [Prevotella sp.]
MLAAKAQSVATDSLTSDSIALHEKKQNIGKRLMTKLSDRYFKTKYDTNYVARPKEKWLFRFMANQTGNYIHAKGTVNDVYSKYNLHTKINTTLSLEVNYCDIAASLSINPSKISGDYNDYEFNFEYHGQKLSFDINYLRATSLSGDIKLGNIDHLDEEGLRMNEVNITGYYTFNHRRFSFPAALYQNYYQRCTAGSWLAGISFQAGSIKTTDKLKERSPLVPEVHLKFSNVALGGGYGYNYVFGKRSQWLLHLSALPSVVVYKHNRLTVNNDEKKDHGLSFNMIFNERAALVYHFSPRYFGGASMMMSNSIFENDKVTVNQNKWLVRAFFGLRL